ncbi:MAG: hypothetical protein CM15mP25_6240 [Gammaproteobacteria bacterium]|nr:MAG: hypothetical protein CM15mP25_6240 [Gammaproteobacteria bacterium]
MAIEAHLHAGGALWSCIPQYLLLGLARVGLAVGRPLGVGHQLAPQPETVTVVPDKDNALADLPSFEVHDELYTDLLLEPGAQVLAHGRSAAMPTSQPIVWSLG